jgi:hypothetical protein
MDSMAQLLPNASDPLISISHLPATLGTVSRTRARDEGLERISTVTRWVAALGVAGTALIAGVVYRAAPGRASSPTSSPASTPATAPTADPNAGVDPNAGFQAPVDAPVPVQQAPIVRSGGS